MKIKTIILLLTLSFLFACQEDDTNSKVDKKPIYFSLLHTHNDTTISFNSSTYTNAAGNRFIPTKLRYFISNVSFEKENGEIIKYDSLYFYYDGKDNDFRFYIPELELGRYKKMSFNIGIDSAMNHSDPTLLPASHPLSLINHNLHWGWIDGFIFYSFEGFVFKNNQSIPFTYHLGLDKNLIEISFDNILHEELKLHTILFNLDDFLSKPNLINQEEEYFITHSKNDNGLSEKLVENLKGSFYYFGRGEIY